MRTQHSQLRHALIAVIAILLAMGVAPPVARAAGTDLSMELPKRPALLELLAVSGDHVLASIRDSTGYSYGRSVISHDRGATLSESGAWAEDGYDYLALEGGVLAFDWWEFGVQLYSLAGEPVGAGYDLPDGMSLLDANTTHALLRRPDNSSLMVALDGSTQRLLPAAADGKSFDWSKLLNNGYAVGTAWDEAASSYQVWSVSPDDALTRVAAVEDSDRVYLEGDLVRYRRASGDYCLHAVPGDLVGCSEYLSGEMEVTPKGVLVGYVADNEDEDVTSLMWLPLVSGVLGEAVPVHLREDVIEFDLAELLEGDPVIATVTSTESYLEWLDPDTLTTTRVATGAREYDVPDLTGLSPTTLLGMDHAYGPGAEAPTHTTWRRSVGSLIGERSNLAELVSDDRASAMASASAGRWLVPSNTGLQLYDRGVLKETLKGVLGAEKSARLSGPHILLEDGDGVDRFRDASGAWRDVPGALDAFGSLVLEDLTHWDADRPVPSFRVRDLSSATPRVLATFAPGEDVGSGELWGDHVAYTTLDDDGSLTEVYNYRTRQVVHTCRGYLMSLGDGFAVTHEWSSGSGGGGETEDSVAVCTFATGERTPLSGSYGRTLVVDGARVAYATGSHLVVKTIAGVAKSAPRVLGVVAASSYTGNGLWTPEIDLTKPVGAGQLVIRNASGAVVRSLSVPASADGSIRGVGWDGKDASGVGVPDGVYSVGLTSTAADGSGAVVRVDGSAGALAEVTVKLPVTALSAATPTISGTATIGSTLTAVPGAWGPAPVSLTYQWLRDGAVISGATKSTYVVSVADVGKRLSVKVTGSKSGYASVSKTSVQTAVVASGSLTAPTPTVSGTAKVGSTLTANAGSWGPAPVSLAYQWLRDGVAISGATKSTYAVAAADVGKRLSVTVTGSKSGYASVSRTSAQTAVVPVPKALTATPVPTVSGTAKVGATLTAKPGSWKPAPVSLAYQWKRGGKAIAGATKASYVVASDDLGATLTVTVTGTKPDYAAVSKTSKATKKVVAGALTAATPSISGTVKVGATVTAKPGTWKPAPVTLKYQWYRSGKAISKATGSSYVLQAADKGKKLTVKVTGAKAGYKSVVKTSKAKKVAAGTLSSATPKITGAAKVGQSLIAEVAAWGPAPVTLKYQWYRSGKAIAKATKPGYTLTASDLGKKITVKVTGSKPGYTTVSKTSKATGKVAAGTLVAGTPTITGEPVVGAKLKVEPGKWGPAPVTLKFQWYRSGKAIAKATRTSYTLVTADRGATITVKVTGTRTGYTTASKNAGPTPAVT